MAFILNDQFYSVLSSSQISITGKNLRSWLNEAGWPTRNWLASVKEFICIINKFSTYFPVSGYINFFICLLVSLVSWKWAGSVSILTFNHGIAHTKKLDRFFFFAQAPCNQNKVFNKQRGYIYRRNKKSCPTYQTNPGYQVSVPYNQPLSYIGILERTFSEIINEEKFLVNNNSKSNNNKK